MYIHRDFNHLLAHRDKKGSKIKDSVKACDMN